MRVFIIGHKSPDLDAVASAVAYKELLYTVNRHLFAEFIAVRADEANKETEYIFERFGVDMPKSLDEYEINETDKFVLVDHNENRQIHSKVNMDNVIEVIDHHKVNLNTNQPVKILTDRMGSTCTVIYNDAQKYQIDWPTDPVKGIVLSAILSDTQGLKSSTTTEVDRRIARKLAGEMGLRLEELIFDIFKAKSDISEDTPEDLVTKDYKIFEFGDKKVFINQIETVEPELVLDQTDKMLKALKNVKKTMNVDYAYIAITDILKIDTMLLYDGEAEKDIAEEAFVVEASKNSVNIGAKLSRKKDIAPAIEKATIKYAPTEVKVGSKS